MVAGQPGFMRMTSRFSWGSQGSLWTMTWPARDPPTPGWTVTSAAWKLADLQPPNHPDEKPRPILLIISYNVKLKWNIPILEIGWNFLAIATYISPLLDVKVRKNPGERTHVHAYTLDSIDNGISWRLWELIARALLQQHRRPTLVLTHHIKQQPVVLNLLPSRVWCHPWYYPRVLLRTTLQPLCQVSHTPACHASSSNRLSVR